MTTTATLEISPTSKRPTAKEAALRATGGAAQYTTVGHDPYRFAGRRRMTTRQNALRRAQTHRTPTPVVGAEHAPERAYGAQSGIQSALGRSRSRRKTYPAEQNATA